MISKFFSQYAIEAELDDLIPHGEKKQLALLMGVSESLVSQQLNPHEEKMSDFYRFLRFLEACDERGLGDKVMDLLFHCRAIWRNEKAHSAQLKSCVDIIESATRLKEQLIKEQNDKNFAENKSANFH